MRIQPAVIMIMMTGCFMVVVVIVSPHIRLLLVVLVIVGLCIRLLVVMLVSCFRSLVLVIVLMSSFRSPVLVLMVMIMPDFSILVIMAMIMHLSVFNDVEPVAGFDFHECLAANGGKNLLHPALHAGTVIDEHIGLLQLSDVPGCWLPIMRLYAAWNKHLHISRISRYLFRELVHRIKADLNIQLTLAGGIGSHRGGRLRFCSACSSGSCAPLSAACRDGHNNHKQQCGGS
ncbi:hypothetical protein D3C77_459080 [compost metagenome]